MAEAALNLKELSRTFEKSNEGFRKVANDNNVNLSKIVKDIAKTFAQQRKDIGSLSDSIEESIHEQQTTSLKMDRLANIFGESIAIQSQMVTHLRNITLGINAVNDNISQMSNAIGSVSNPAQGSLLNILSSATAFAGGALLGGAMGGGATTDSSVGKGGAEFQSLAPKITQDLQKDFPGLTKEDAAAILGNLGEESGGFTKMQEAGGSGPGRGWAQWTSPDRKAKFLANVAKHGGDLANYDANYETLRDELKGDYAKALRATMEAKGLQNKTQVFMQQFENPGVPAFGVRMNYAQRAMNVLEGSQTTTKEATKQETSPSVPAPTTPPNGSTTPEAATPTATPTASATQAAMQNPTALSEVIPHQHHEGMISGPMKEAKENSSLPAGDIIALGKALQSQGLRVSEHDAFGGVKSKHKGRGHAEGRAIDINIGYGNVESRDPAMGSRFDALASQLNSLGYKIFWRGQGQGPYGLAGHEDHLHAEVPRSGALTPQAEQMGAQAGLPPSRPAELSSQGETQSYPQQAATPMATPTASPMTGEMGMNPAMMMGMLGGLGGIGNIGGMLGMAMPLLGGLLNTLGSPQNMPQMAMSQQPMSKMINEAAVQSQAMMEQRPEAGLANIPNIIDQGMQNIGRQMFASYNNDQDLSWPDWAGNIGGWNWGHESKKTKFNMNQIG